MMRPELQTVAPIVIGHILNSLPEGLLIARVTWLMLRILPRQNSGTAGGKYLEYPSQS